MVADLYAAMLCAGVILHIVGYASQRLFDQVIGVPVRLIILMAQFLCRIGAYMKTDCSQST